HAMASGKRLRTTTPTPLPQTVPSDPASKGRQDPLAEKMSPSRCQYPCVCGTRMVAPPASAISHSPASRLWQARCSATSDVEHEVCTVMLGPVSPSLYETLVVR